MKTTIRSRLLASTLYASAVAMGAIAAAALNPSVAAAQDYTSGTLAGMVETTAGEPVGGAAVTVRSLDQGFTRTFTTDENGRFRAPLLPIGRYSVSVEKSGFEKQPDANVAVALGGESAYTFTLRSPGEVAELVVTGSAAAPALDFAATTRGLTVDMETLTKQVPVARNIQSVTLLAPTVLLGSSSGDVTFANQPSIGGGSIAENAFYVNGLNITNFNTYVGGATVPFDFYKSIEVKTAGYPAEFGRAVGGVINAVTKSGTNDFYFAVHGNWESAELQNRGTDTFQYADRLRENENRDLTFEIGGPIIRDRLFVYGLAQLRDNETRFARIDQRAYYVETSDDPFYGAKVDFLLTDDHRFEGTYFNTQRTTLRQPYTFTNATSTIGAATAPTVFDQGGESYVFRYTGAFTDWFTLSAAYGKTGEADSVLSTAPGANRVDDARSGTTVTISEQKLGSNDRLSTEREFWRVDGDFYFNAFGQHHVRMGFDHEDTTLFHELARTGGRRYIYRRGSANDTRGVPAGQDYVEVETVRIGGPPVRGSNESFYIQDSWDVTDDFNIQAGLRHDAFELSNLGGEKVLDLDGNWGPRLGFTWDPFGEGKDKIYGSIGRYFIPPASNLSFRGADLGFSEFFLAPAGGFNIAGGTGLPAALGGQITPVMFPLFDDRLDPAACPAGGVGTIGLRACVISLGIGVPEPAYSKTAHGLKATHEDEFQVGYQRQINDLWRAGAAFTYRTLKNVSEDLTLDPYMRAYCTRNGIVGCDEIWTNSWQYVVFNPGEDLTVTTRGPLPGRTAPSVITFSAEELGFPKPKREYFALELTFERAFDGKWGLNGSYVLSESRGNYEGTVLSDAGQDDAGSTLLFDFLGLTDNQFGLLPNHRAHQFKLYGSYAVTENLLVGANARVISPKHLGCLGIHPTDEGAAGYEAESRYCQGQPVPRGSRLTTDWQTNVDLSARYTLNQDWMPLGSELVLRADIFNVFDTHSVTDRWEFGDLGSGAPDPNYGSPTAYQRARYVRLGFDLTF